MLFINNDDVQQVLNAEDTIRALEAGHRELGRHELVARPRVDVYTQTDSPAHFHRWGTMEGSSMGLHRHAIRMKSDIISWRDQGDGRVEDKYCTEPGLFCGLVLLFDTNSGEPLAIINDGYLQHLRVGALAALGAKYLAREDATEVGMLGTGGMAHSHLMAFAAVRPLRRVKVYSPTREHREAYAAEMSALLDLDVVACDTPEDAVTATHLVASCTNSVRPTVFSRMLEPGMHLSCVMGEFADDVPGRVDVTIGGDPTSQVVQGVPVDDTHGFTTYLAGDADALREAMGPGRRRDGLVDADAGRKAFRGRTVSLVDLIAGNASGRLSSAEISASNGVAREAGKQGLQFVTVGSLVYDRVKAAGLGREIPTEWFLQTIRN